MLRWRGGAHVWQRWDCARWELTVFLAPKPTPVYLSRPPVFRSAQSKMPKWGSKLFLLQLKVPYYAELASTSAAFLRKTKVGGRNVSVASRDEK